jgi:lipopolysaccharide export LptBFGC system permease protein LptF
MKRRPLIAHLALSAFLTASVMPFVLIAAPSVRSHPRLGLGIVAGMVAVFWALISAGWSWRRSQQ